MKIYYYFRKQYIKLIYCFKKKTTYSLSLNDLLKREDINPKYTNFLRKMTNEEITEMSHEMDRIIYEQGTPLKYPDWDVQILTKLIDRDILFRLMELAMEEKELMEKYKNKEVNSNLYQKITITHDGTKITDYKLN